MHPLQVPGAGSRGDSSMIVGKSRFSGPLVLIVDYSKSGLVRNWLVRNLALAFWGRRDIYIEKITFIRLYTAHIKKLASAAGPI